MIEWNDLREEGSLMPCQPQQVLGCWASGVVRVVWFTSIPHRLWAQCPDGTGHGYCSPDYWAEINLPPCNHVWKTKRGPEASDRTCTLCGANEPCFDYY